MRIDILTIFPKMFDSPFAESVIKWAVAEGKVTIQIHNPCKWVINKCKTVSNSTLVPRYSQFFEPTIM